MFEVGVERDEVVTGPAGASTRQGEQLGAAVGEDDRTGGADRVGECRSHAARPGTDVDGDVSGLHTEPLDDHPVAVSVEIVPRRQRVGHLRPVDIVVDVPMSGSGVVGHPTSVPRSPWFGGGRFSSGGGTERRARQ